MKKKYLLPVSSVIFILITVVNIVKIDNDSIRSHLAFTMTQYERDIYKDTSVLINTRRFNIDKVNYNNFNVSISVCIPAVEADIITALPRLLQSIQSQTLHPLEIIVVISNCSRERCRNFKTIVTSWFVASKINIYCKKQLQLQSLSREEAASYARGSVVSFIDADDMMYPNRLEVISILFRSYRPLMVLHGFSNSRIPPYDTQWKTAPIISGESLYDIAKSTEVRRVYLLASVVHSHMSVLRGTLNMVKFRKEKKFYRSEDALFIRDFISFFCKRNTTAIFIDTPLSWYVPRLTQVT